MICRFVFSGSGGQGIITAAILLAETAVYFDGLKAIQTQTYGPEARGGSARADVIISSDQIHFPKVLQPNVLVCLNQEAYDKYNLVVRPGGVILLDSSMVRYRKNVSARQWDLPLQDTVQKELGSILPLNMCTLGALARIIEFITLDSLEQIIGQRFTAEHKEKNKKALHLGYNLAETLIGEPPLLFL